AGSRRGRGGVAGLPSRHLVRHGRAAPDARGAGRQDQSRCGRNPRSTGRGRKDARNSDGTGHENPFGGGAILHRGGAALGQGDPPSQYSTAVAPDRKSRRRLHPGSSCTFHGKTKSGNQRVLPLRSSTRLPLKAAWRGVGVPHTVAKDNPV